MNNPLVNKNVMLSTFIIISVIIGCQKNVDETLLNQPINNKLLREDLNFLIKNLEKRHVNFYERANQDSIQLMKMKIDSMLIKNMNRTEFFKIIALLNPYFNDAHCLVFPLREEAQNKKEKGFPLFPFQVELDQLGVLKPEQSYKRLSDGALIDKSWQITSINGVPTETIIGLIEKYSHGETKNLRKHMTTLLFSDWLFSIYGWSGKFEIAFYKQNKKILVEPSDSWKSLELNVVQSNRLEILANKIGYLRLGSFDVDEHKNQYQEFVESSFNRISREKVNKLIIDLRGNTGGQSDAGAQVLRYLTSKNLSQVSKAYDRIHEGNTGWLNYRGKPGELKELDLSSDDIIKPIETEKQFKGKFVVLFDEMTYSAGIIFITIIQDHKLALTVGRPTGGFANQTGNIETFQLPNTKLTIYAPSRKFIRVNGDTKIHSVIPNLIVNQTNSITKVNDLVLETGIKLLNKIQN